ncbi:MAG: HNH endonuclease signature motif containing protein [Gemmataceae bacterium]
MTDDRATTPCGLCGRAFDPRALTKHHCLPRSQGGTMDHVELICGQCHSMIHCTYENSTLAQCYATLAELRQAAELQNYIRWVRKQPPTRRTKNKPRKRRL